MSNYGRRRFKDKLALSLGILCVLIALVPLASILYYVVKNGAPAISWEFLTSPPGPVGQPGGGIGPSIQGTIVLVGLASLIGVPVGVASGIFLSEFGDNSIGRVIRFLNDVLAEFPSVVIGVVIFTIVVLSTRSFSVIAGSLALSIIMLPIVARSTEESLKLVPNTIRDAAMALGIRKWRATLSIVLTTAKSGIITAILLAVARIAGETAPLVFTVLGSDYFLNGLTGAADALPLRVFRYAQLPYASSQQQGWGAALVLILMVLVLNLGVRFATRGRLNTMRVGI